MEEDRNNKGGTKGKGDGDLNYKKEKPQNQLCL